MNKKALISYVVIVILTAMSFLGGTTFAKYLTSYDTSLSFSIAKWSVTEEFLVNGSSSTSKNINLATTYNTDTLASGKIAPGSSGSFGVVIDTTGTETGVDYKVTFDNVSGTKPTNLVFTYNNNTFNSLESLSNILKGKIATNADKKILNLEIGWSWIYDSLDVTNIKQKEREDTLDRSNYFKLQL